VPAFDIFTLSSAKAAAIAEGEVDFDMPPFKETTRRPIALSVTDPITNFQAIPFFLIGTVEEDIKGISSSLAYIIRIQLFSSHLLDTNKNYGGVVNYMYALVISAIHKKPSDKRVYQRKRGEHMHQFALSIPNAGKRTERARLKWRPINIEVC
jgi:hypothetical protein